MSAEAGFEGMVNELTHTMLRSIGYTGDPAVLSGAIAQVLAAAGSHSHCQLRFHAHDGKLRIAVTCDGHARWQTSLALPLS